MKYLFVKQLIGSVVHIDFYKEVIQRPILKAIVYLFLLSLCLGMMLGVKWYFIISQKAEQLMMDFQAKAPGFVFENKTLKGDGKAPYIAKTEDSWCIFVVDPSGRLDEGILAQYENAWLISDNKIVSRTNGAEIVRRSFAELPDVHFTKQDVVNWLPYIKYIIVIALLVLFVYYYLTKLAGVLLLYFFGSIIAAAMRVKIKFADLCKVGIYSLTLPMILELLLKLADQEIPAFLWLYYGLAMGYVIMVLWSLRKQQRQTRGKVI